MYAVIKAGGKQHRVKPGDVIEVELMHGGHGEAVTFTPLLVVDDDGKTHVGKDLGRAVVKAKLVGEEKGDKVKIFKYRPKTGYSRRQGHRQMYTLVEIEEVAMGRRAAPKADAKESAPQADAKESAPQADESAPEAPAPEAPEAAAAASSETVAGSEPTPEEIGAPSVSDETTTSAEEVSATAEEALPAEEDVEGGTAPA